MALCLPATKRIAPDRVLATRINEHPMANHPITIPISRAGQRSPSHSSVGLWTTCFGLLVVAFVTGCQSTGGDKYSFRDMPPELLAAKRENAQTLDLTRLARASANSDVIDRGDVVEVSIAAGLDEKDVVKIPVRVNDLSLIHI